jgi:alcohol dehydrogenase class IV
MSAATLAALARLARAPLLFEPQAATKVAAFAREQMRLPPGAKCVVVATATAAKRAAIVTHFLRRGGYLPLQCELPDGAPLESSVAQVMDAARRTGAGFLAAYGGGATLSVGKAAAALLVNEGSVSLYAPELGGRQRLARPSLPFLAVPSCPSGAELHRDAHVLFQGQALATLAADVKALAATRATLEAASLEASLQATSERQAAAAALKAAAEKTFRTAA